MKLQLDKNEQFKLTLPKQIILAKGWKKGDKIAIVIDESGNLILKNSENNGNGEKKANEVLN